MRIAIFGGAGQIGYHLTRYLNTTREFEAIALCRSSLVTAGLRFNNLPFRIYDSQSEESIHAALDDCQVVIDSTFAPMRRFDCNAMRTVFQEAVMNAAGIKQVIHFSSVAVYGELSGATADIRHPKPDTLYGAQKLATERIVRKIGRQTGVPLLICRLGHVYGAEMSWSLDFVSRIRDGQLPSTHLEKPSNAIHVGQLCRTIRQAIEQADCGCRNFVGSPNLSWREILAWHDRAREAVDGDGPQPAARNYRPDSSRSKRGRIALGTEVLRALKSSVLLGLTGSPRIAHAMRMFLASFPWAPGKETLKSTVGSPGMERYFAGTSGDETDFVFDSLRLTDPETKRIDPVGQDDLRTLEAWLRSISDPSGLLDYLNQALRPKEDQYPAHLVRDAQTKELLERHSQ